MTTTHDLGDQCVRLQTFVALGVPCVKEVITANARSGLPKHRVFWYVDTARVPMMSATARGRLARSCKSLDELVGLIENAGAIRRRTIPQMAQMNTTARP